MSAQVLAPLSITIPLIIFYLWMFRDMLNNDYLSSNPWAFLGILGHDHSPGNVKFNWAVAFLLLNVFAAALYYSTEYRGQ